MKILMATMGLDIGGAETHIVELSKELKSRGHQVAVVSNGGVYVPEIEAAGIRHYAAPLNRRSVGSMLQAQRILRQIIAREKPDIVHAHARIPAFLCGRLQKSMGFAFVTSCHGVYQVSGALRLLSNWGERTLAVSEDIRDYLIRQYNVPQEHITLTINGCPNSCARIQIADIGLKGQIITVDGEQMPGFQVHLGGGLAADGRAEAGLGRTVRGLKVPASGLTDYVERLVRRYLDQRIPEETFAQWAHRADEEALQ